MDKSAQTHNTNPDFGITLTHPEILKKNSKRFNYSIKS